MRRAFIAVLMTAFLAAPLLAQRGMRGGGFAPRGGGFAPRGGAFAPRSFHGPTFAPRGSAPRAFAPHQRFFPGPRARVFARPFPRNRVIFISRRPFFSAFGSFYPYPLSYGYPIYPYDYGYGPGYVSADYQSVPTQYNNDPQLTREVADLRDEVERLRDDLNRQQYAAPPTQAQAAPHAAQPVPPAPPTLLVFNDGRREDVANYAIAGKTLWILTEQRARKVPLAELNVQATTRANADRGIDFRIPHD